MFSFFSKPFFSYIIGAQLSSHNISLTENTNLETILYKLYNWVPAQVMGSSGATAPLSQPLVISSQLPRLCQWPGSLAGATGTCARELLNHPPFSDMKIIILLA